MHTKHTILCVATSAQQTFQFFVSSTAFVSGKPFLLKPETAPYTEIDVIIVQGLTRCNVESGLFGSSSPELEPFPVRSCKCYADIRLKNTKKLRKLAV
eukprot:1160396-Pelagomonas_calceolata.AAC.21